MSIMQALAWALALLCSVVVAAPTSLSSKSYAAHEIRCSGVALHLSFENDQLDSNSSRNLLGAGGSDAWCGRVQVQQITETGDATALHFSSLKPVFGSYLVGTSDSSAHLRADVPLYAYLPTIENLQQPFSAMLWVHLITVNSSVFPELTIIQTGCARVDEQQGSSGNHQLSSTLAAAGTHNASEFCANANDVMNTLRFELVPASNDSTIESVVSGAVLRLSTIQVTLVDSNTSDSDAQAVITAVEWVSSPFGLDMNGYLWSGQWQHFAFSCTGMTTSSTCTLFLNGKLLEFQQVVSHRNVSLPLSLVTQADNNDPSEMLMFTLKNSNSQDNASYSWALDEVWLLQRLICHQTISQFLRYNSLSASKIKLHRSSIRLLSPFMASNNSGFTLSELRVISRPDGNVTSQIVQPHLSFFSTPEASGKSSSDSQSILRSASQDTGQCVQTIEMVSIANLICHREFGAQFTSGFTLLLELQVSVDTREPVADAARLLPVTSFAYPGDDQKRIELFILVSAYNVLSSNSSNSSLVLRAGSSEFVISMLNVNQTELADFSNRTIFNNSTNSTMNSNISSVFPLTLSVDVTNSSSFVVAVFVLNSIQWNHTFSVDNVCLHLDNQAASEGDSLLTTYRTDNTLSLVISSLTVLVAPVNEAGQLGLLSSGDGRYCYSDTTCAIQHSSFDVKDSWNDLTVPGTAGYQPYKLTGKCGLTPENDCHLSPDEAPTARFFSKGSDCPFGGCLTLAESFVDHTVLVMTDKLELFTNFTQVPDWTLSFWFRFPSDSLARGVGQYTLWEEVPYFQLVVDVTKESKESSTVDLWYATRQLIPEGITTVASSVAVDTWHHVVLRHEWASNVLETFFNGQLAAHNVLYSSTTSPSAPRSQHLGGHYAPPHPSNHFPGHLDEVWLWSIFISEDSIQSLMNTNSLLRCPPGTKSMDGTGTYSAGCIACSLGSTNLGGSTPCDGCPLGSFVNSVHVCEQCPAGMIAFNPETSAYPPLSHVPFATECVSTAETQSAFCRPGQESRGNAHYCWPCLPGTFTAEFGVAYCQNCPPGTFSRGGMSFCWPLLFLEDESNAEVMIDEQALGLAEAILDSESPACALSPFLEADPRAVSDRTRRSFSSTGVNVALNCWSTEKLMDSARVQSDKQIMITRDINLQDVAADFCPGLPASHVNDMVAQIAQTFVQSRDWWNLLATHFKTAQHPTKEDLARKEVDWLISNVMGVFCRDSSVGPINRCLVNWVELAFTRNGGQIDIRTNIGSWKDNKCAAAGGNVEYVFAPEDLFSNPMSQTNTLTYISGPVSSLIEVKSRDKLRAAADQSQAMRQVFIEMITAWNVNARTARWLAGVPVYAALTDGYRWRFFRISGDANVALTPFDTRIPPAAGPLSYPARYVIETTRWFDINSDSGLSDVIHWLTFMFLATQKSSGMCPPRTSDHDLSIHANQPFLSTMSLLTPNPSVAVSVQRLSSLSAHCLRVRRVSDGLTRDIGFTRSGVIDVDALLQFVNAAGPTDGEVVVWYDQSGADNHLVQHDSVARGPLIVVGGVLADVDPNTGLPGLRFDNARNQPARMALALSTPMSNVSYVAARVKRAASSNGFLLCSTTEYNWHAKYEFLFDSANCRPAVCGAGTIAVVDSTVYQPATTAPWPASTVTITVQTTSNSGVTSRFDNIGRDRVYNHFAGVFHELIVFQNQVPSSEDRTKLQRRLRALS